MKRFMPFKGIRIRESGKNNSWNPESWALEFGIQLKERLEAINWNTDPRRGIQIPRLSRIPFHGIHTSHAMLSSGVP